MTHRFILDGQPMVYNAGRKLGNTSIEEPFLKAGKTFDFKGPGIGLNPKICEFIILRKAKLMVRVESFHQTYWISWDKLKVNYEKSYDYKAGGHKWVKVIPLSEFNEKIEMMAA